MIKYICQIHMIRHPVCNGLGYSCRTRQYDAAFLLMCVKVDVLLVYSIHKQEQRCKNDGFAAEKSIFVIVINLEIKYQTWSDETECSNIFIS